ncbi:hypothetical protein [uncultured Cohaesibacter sp.]|uniref:ImuA family protein n=1 Tax=uncultured Cohaesibacter sp. TaxID=1002546 RepID=UPI00292D9F80|nr:hypothetical protein [uncultured Cohaesibacter sp.]
MNDPFASAFPLRAGRAHEVTGQGATAFAAIVCGLGTKADQRPSLWLVEDWRADLINPVGLACFCDPSRLLLVRVPDQKSMLACAEEALRSGAVSCVVTELPRALSFTAGRRLQLAAEEGKSTGILMIGEGMGNNAAESRWHCAPLFSPHLHQIKTVSSLSHSSDSTLQRWQLIKNKSGTLGCWDIIWDAETRRVIVVSEVGERPYSAAQGRGRALCSHVAAE